MQLSIRNTRKTKLDRHNAKLINSGSSDLTIGAESVFGSEGPDLFVQPSSDHHRHIGIPLDGLLSLPKAVHFATGAGTLGNTTNIERDVI